ncbi:alpha/beta hydrolase-fold protein, partial [Pseudomonas aeruginosa]|nr:alpha/beta hydrolase-fold protein [Pseudomonas aeruginosa]
KDVPRGKVERLGYSSQALANQRQLTLYTPPGYDPEGQRYPLLVLFDEDHYARDVPTPTILDNLIAAGRIRPTLAVIVGNVDASSRGRELPCNEAFADMLAHELLPWLQQRYALSEEPADRVLSGSSYGGLASGCIAYRYPERFGKVLSLSGSFWWGPDEQQPQWLVRQFAAGERLPLVFFLSSGLLEEPEADGILGSNRSLRAALQGKGYPLHYREFPGGHDYAAWSLELAGAAEERFRICRGHLEAGDTRYALADLLQGLPEDALQVEVEAEPSARRKGYATATHSAVFVEVRIDEALGTLRVSRVVSAVAAGRVINPKTARSQILGGVVWGLGMALQEETQVDHALGRCMNHNLAEYHIPVNADIGDIEVIFVDEPDDIVNELGSKGVGEIGIVGVAAAVANAVYHATGRRLRDFPLTVDKLLG